MIRRLVNTARRWRSVAAVAWRYRVRRSARLPYGPLRLWIEPTNACNLRCEFCPTGVGAAGNRGFMDESLYAALIEQAAGFAFDINLHHRGESLLHPNLARMVGLAADRGLRVRLHTNGTRLDEVLGETLAESGLWTISFSFDSAEAARYEQVRRGAGFEQTVANIRRFLAIKRRPHAAVEAMCFDGDPHSLRRDLRRLFADTPPDAIVVKQPHNWGGAVGSPAGGCVTCACTMPWYAMTTFWDGRVSPCPQDYHGRLIVGDAKVQPLLGIWNGEPMRKLRASHARHDVAGVDPCRDCDRIRRPTIGGVPADFLGRFLREYLG